MSFRDRLRDEISFKGFQKKEFAAKIGISYSTFLSYIDKREIIPPTDISVKIAQALGVSVEYLITGKDIKHSTEFERMYKKFRGILSDMDILPEEVLIPIKAMIHTAADEERKKHDSANNRLA